ncbi:MAG: hypothetical protein ACRDU9_04125 [Acidimicrobiia bacterium]
MTTFLTTLLIVTVLLLVLGAPLTVPTWRKGQRKTARSWLIGAGVIGVLCASIAMVSERQVTQCLDAGNTDCIDSGAAGLQLVFIVLYLVSAWIGAFLVWRE